MKTYKITKNSETLASGIKQSGNPEIKGDIVTLSIQVIDWADNRGLLNKNSDPQFLKIIEEFGEWAKWTLKQNDEEIKDGLGDTLVTVIIYCAQNDKTNQVLDVLSNSKYSQLDVQEYNIYKHACSVIFNLSSMFYASGSFQPFLGNLLNSLNTIANTQGLTLYECLEAAYNVIKNRQGKMINGTFIKSEDLPKGDWGVPVEE